MLALHSSREHLAVERRRALNVGVVQIPEVVGYAALVAILHEAQVTGMLSMHLCLATASR